MHTMFWKSVLLSLAIIAFWIVFGRVKRVTAVKRLLDVMLLNTPVWGTLHRYRSLARFLHELYGLYAAGIPPGTAWGRRQSCAEEQCDCGEARWRAVRLHRARSSRVICRVGVFDQEDVAMAGVGESPANCRTCLPICPVSMTTKPPLRKG